MMTSGHEDTSPLLGRASGSDAVRTPMALGDGAGVLDAEHRRLTAAVVLTVTAVAFQSMGIVTVLPAAARDLDGLNGYGWSMTAFMLASLLATVAGGDAADRGQRVRGFVCAIAVLVIGSALSAVAPSWTVLLGGRVLQGAGVGALMAVAYAAVSQGYAESLRARVIALLATSWFVPSLAGPVLAGLLSDHASWRVAFLLVLPLLAPACVLGIPTLRSLDLADHRYRRIDLIRLRWALRLVTGVGLGVSALGWGILMAAPGIVLGSALAIPALRQLLPRGTLRARGAGAGIAARGLLAAACIGVEAFVLLALTGPFGLTATAAGLVATVGAATWAAGSWVAARFDGGGARRAPLISIGGVVLALGLAICAVALMHDAGAALMGAGWGVIGLGMGVGQLAATSAALAAAGTRSAGAASASLYVVDTVAISVVSGFGGVLIAARAEAPAAPLALTFSICAVIALGAAAVGPRVRRAQRDGPSRASSS